MKAKLLLLLYMLIPYLAFAQFNGSGTGTSSDPYIILNADQFYSIRNFQSSKTYFSLINDIDLSDYAYGSGWEPIPSFQGVLDGNGHKIRGLVINRKSTDKVGLFASTYGATIKNLIVEGSVTGKDKVGGIVGQPRTSDNSSKYENVHFHGSVNGNNYVGGIAGYEESSGTEYSECGFSGTIIGVDYIGGIAGRSYGAHITHSSSMISVRGNQYVGGICGEAGGFIEDCYASVDILASSGYVGGIAGEGDGDIKRCSVNGKIVALGDKVGGIIGNVFISSYATSKATLDFCVLDSYFAGYLKGRDYVGGISGRSNGSALLYVRIRKNYVKGTIIGNDNVGGISGSVHKAVVESNVCMCSSIESETANVGRILGSDSNDTPKKCYSIYNTKVCIAGVNISSEDIQSKEDIHGIDIGENNLKTATFYQGLSWDFGSAWAIINTESIPYHQTQAAPPIIQSSLVCGETSISGNSLDGGTVEVKVNNTSYVAPTSNYFWNITVPELHSGEKIVAHATADGLFPSYNVEKYVSYLGSGTQEDPYLIKTYTDLKNLHGDGNYKLANDIDLSSQLATEEPTSGWQPLGVYAEGIKYLDGDNHTISNLYISRNEDNVGLFASLTDATIKNLIIETVSGKGVQGANNVGILAGRLNNCTIQNVSIKGEVNGITNIGGLCGEMNGGTISNISVLESTIVGKNLVGGIAGTSSATATLCSFKGSVSDYVEENDGIKNGTIVYVGGLFSTSRGVISQSSASGTVTSTRTDSRAGGLVGDNYARISDCYSVSNVSGDVYAAGIAAYNQAPISNCYASGDISTSNESAQTIACGLVGYNDGVDASILQSAAMNMHITSSSDVGNVFRIIGGTKNSAPIPDQTNFALQNMILSVNGIRMSISDDPFNGYMKHDNEFKTQALYKNNNWDFDAIWKISENESYPLLKQLDIDPLPSNIPITEVSLGKSTLILSVGESVTLSATVTPTDATNKNINWTSSANGVATVSAEGLVTAVAEGEATITATAADGSGVKATCTVTVVKDNTEAINALRALVENARNRYDNSTEGDNPGQYAAGSRAALLAVINAVDEAIADMMTLEDVNACTSQINAAVAEFESHKVSLGEDTDITTLDNVIYIEPIEVSCGQAAEVSVKMKNSIAATGFQFNMYLPEGVSVVKDADDFCDVSLSTARTTTNKTNTFDASIVSDGSLMVLAASTKNYAFSGNDGEVARINLDVAEDLEEGEYPLILRNIEITDASGTPYRVAYLKTTLTVSSYKIGDVNADGSVSVADFSAIASHILENTPAGFVVKAADVNTDGYVTVSDLSSLVPIIIAESTGGASMSPKKNVRSKVKTDISGKDNIIYASDVTVAPGEDFTVSFNMKNLETAMTGFQYNVTLPEGITVCEDADGFLEASLSTARTTTAKTNTFDASIVSDGTLMVLAASTKNYTFGGTDGEVVTVKMHADENIAAGTYDLKIDRIELTDDKGTPFRPGEPIVSALTVKAAQTLTEVDFDFTDPTSLGITPAEEIDDVVDITKPITKNGVTATIDGGVEVTIDADAYILEIDRAGALTLSTTTPNKIVKVEFGDDADAYIDKLSAATGTLDGFVWTGSEEEVVFEVADTRNAVADITTIKVWLEGGEAPAEELTFTDGTAYTATAAKDYGKVTYTRTFNNLNWQALYVPFSMNYDEWSEKYDIAEIHNFIEYDDDENGTFDRTYLVVLKKTSGSTEPNYPYLIRAKETGTHSLVLTDKTLEAAESTSIDCSSVKNRYTFTGTYAKVEDMYTNGYWALSGGALNKANAASVTLNAQRWYMEVTSRTGSSASVKAQSIQILVDGEEGIETLSNSPEGGEPVAYDLTGRAVSTANNIARGVNIVNGKKLIK